MSAQWTWSEGHGDYYYYRLRPGTEPPQFDLIWARSQLNTPQPPAPALAPALASAPVHQPSFTSNEQHEYYRAPISNVSTYGNTGSHSGLQNNAYTNQRSYSSGPGIGTNPAYSYGHSGFGSAGYSSISRSSPDHTHRSMELSTFAGSAYGTQPITEDNQNCMASVVFASSDTLSDDEAAYEAPGFETVREPKRFLRKGRIFEVPTEIEGKVRRYVVIRPKSKHCLCLAIRTYSRMATAKPGVNADDHAPLVCDQRQVELHPNERPLRKEKLSVVVEEDTLRLNPRARLDFGRIFAIDHKDVYMRSVGRIDPQSMTLLEDYFRSGIGVDEPEETEMGLTQWRRSEVNRRPRQASAEEVRLKHEHGPVIYDGSPDGLKVWIEKQISSCDNPAIRLDINWDLFAFLDQEYPETMDLGRILTISGSYGDAYATYATQYVGWQWPQFGGWMLDFVFKAKSEFKSFQYFTQEFRDTVGSSITITAERHNDGIRLDVRGRLNLIGAVSEQLLWLTAAFRRPSAHGLSTSRATIQYHGFVEHADFFSVQLQRLQVPVTNSKTASCWNPIFDKFAIAHDFPFPVRENGERGIELPFALMVALGGVSYPLQYLDSFVLKGRTTVIVPTSRYESSIQWHLVQNHDGSDLSMDKAHSLMRGLKILMREGNPFTQFVDSLTSPEHRHFLGLYKGAKVYLGTEDSNAHMIATCIDHRNTQSYKPGLIWKRTLNVTLLMAIHGFGAQGQTAFDIPGSARTKLACNELNIDDHIDRSRENVTVMYDVGSSCAWLVPEICVILHLIHRWAGQKGANRCPPFASATSRGDDAAADILRQSGLEALREPPRFGEKTTLINRFLVFRHLFLQLKETIIESGGTLFSMFDSAGRDKLVGFDFATLSELPDEITALQARLHCGSGGWAMIPKYTRSTLTLFCRNLSPPIRPTGLTQLCPTWNPLPTGCDYLIASTHSIRKLSGNGQPRLSTHHYWKRSEIMGPWEQCRKKNCNLVQKLSDKEPKDGQRVPEEWMDDRWLDGAVLFGGCFHRHPDDRCDARRVCIMNAELEAPIATIEPEIPLSSSRISTTIEEEVI